MPIDRREFLGLLGASLMAPSVLSASLTPRASYLSARTGTGGDWFVSGFDEDGAMTFDLPIPGRGHAATTSPGGGEAVLVARRPGRFLAVVDLRQGRIRRQVEAAPGRHFCGHGVFSRDGRLFYTTENDFDRGCGVIGVRDANDGYRRVTELPSHGIGPHELLLGADGRTLIVANGGILTHPDRGRTKLNLDTMSPSLAYLDAATGGLLEERRLPQDLHRLSIRHLAAAPDGAIWMAMQYQGPRTDHPPLAGQHRRGEPIRLLRAPAQIQDSMRNYCGSICADPSGRWFAVSAPRGGLIAVWNTDGGFAGSADLADGCGLAPGRSEGEFLLSSGVGERLRYQIMDGQRHALRCPAPAGARWDNHLSHT